MGLKTDSVDRMIANSDWFPLYYLENLIDGFYDHKTIKDKINCQYGIFCHCNEIRQHYNHSDDKEKARIYNLIAFHQQAKSNNSGPRK